MSGIDTTLDRGVSMLKLGSLFSGSGTCELAAVLCGINPVWASEIENFPIQVTTKRFPGMKHLGDIRKINGANIEPVDIITGGTPCQDMSVAGRRKGIQGQKSSLFFEFTRVIKEMRGATSGEYPRFVLWENVTGAFSSNRGHDFRAVLETFAEADIPIPDGGKWAKSGLVELQGRQIAWRTLCASHWGVPQRRKRIFLVCDFGGKCAGEILFERQSLHGHTAPGYEAWKRITGTSERCFDGASEFNASGFGEVGAGYRQRGIQTLRARGGDTSNVVIYPEVRAVNQNVGGEIRESDTAYTINTNNNSSGRNAPLVYTVVHPAIAGTLCASGAGLSRPAGQCNETDLCVVQTYTKQRHDEYKALDVASCLTARDYKTAADLVCTTKRIIRRLMPLECAKLQGFPIWWCSGIPHSDTAEYKLWGNGMALPCVTYIIQKIAEIA